MKKATRILFTALRFTIAIGLLVYLAVSGAINWSALRGFNNGLATGSRGR